MDITGDITIEGWVNLVSAPANGTVYTFVSKLLGIGDQRSYEFYYYNNSGTKQLRFLVSNDGINADDQGVNVDLGIGTWKHVIVTWKASTSKFNFYVDGSLQGAEQTGSYTSIYNSTADLNVGRSTAGYNYSDTKMDDIRVWNTVRTATQISDNKNSELIGNESGLAAYYSFEPLLQSKINYFTSNDGINFSRSTTSTGSGLTTQTENSDGSVTVSVNSATSYADSGFVLYEGTLGNLPDFTVNGTGDQYSLNIWLDTGSNNDFFAWTSNVFTGLDGDTYALGPASSSGVDAITGSTQFYLMSDSQNHTLSALRSGSVSGISSSTKVAVWVGVNTTSGSISSTINSITGL